MKISYSDERKAYCVQIEYPETEIWTGGDNIVEARRGFVAYMTDLFDDALREQLKEIKR